MSRLQAHLNGGPRNPRPLSLLIVEGDTPERVAGVRRAGGLSAADSYAASLRAYAPNAALQVVTPSDPTTDVDAIDLSDLDGAALTGSGVSWSADDARAAPHRRLFERLSAAGVPTTGSCWGLQVAAVVLGGTVRWCPNGLELGVAREVRLTAEGAAHPVFSGKPQQFDSVCIHRDEVDRLPSGATLLASNAHSAVQAFAYERQGVRFVGWQYHPELTLGDIAGYLTTRDGGSGDESLAAMITDFRAIDSAAPGAEAARARRNAGADVLCPARRRRELGAWVAGLRRLRPTARNDEQLGAPPLPSARRTGSAAAHG